MHTAKVVAIKEHRGSPRFWTEGSAPLKSGFVPGSKFVITRHGAGILLKLDESGDRKVSKKEYAAGKQVPVIDINSAEALEPLKGCEVVRVVSPGLCLEAESLDEKRDNPLVVIRAGEGGFALAGYELTTGRLVVCAGRSAAEAAADLARLEPREVLLHESARSLEMVVRASLPRVTVRLGFERASSAAARAVTLTLTDDDGGETVLVKDLSATVAPPTEVSGSVQPAQVSAGGTVNFVGRFYNPSPREVYTASIDWGDGSPATTLTLPTSTAATCGGPATSSPAVTAASAAPSPTRTRPASRPAA